MCDDLLADDDTGEGPTLVLVRGHPFDRRMWAQQLGSLSADFRVLAPDLPGYGGSPPPGGTPPPRRAAGAQFETP